MISPSPNALYEKQTRHQTRGRPVPSNVILFSLKNRRVNKTLLHRSRRVEGILVAWNKKSGFISLAHKKFRSVHIMAHTKFLDLV
jgi:hypothetical protein